MDYQIENPSPVKTKISVTSSPNEVNEILNKTREQYRANVQIPGFRKGKALPGMVEKRFHTEIYEEARDDLINEQLQDILQKENIDPVSPIKVNKEGELQRDRDYPWFVEFEVLPEFDLPVYEGLEETLVTEKFSEEKLAHILNNLRKISSDRVKAKDAAPAVDGQIANIDIDMLKDGQPIPEFSSSGYEFEVGSREILPEIETLVKGTPVGNVAQKTISFPENFLDPKLAGQNLDVRIKVNSVFDLDDSKWRKSWEGPEKEKKYAKLKDSFAKLEQQRIDDLHKSETEKKLLDQLLKQTDFSVPQILVDFEQKRLLSDINEQLKLQGKSLSALGENAGEIIAKTRENAEEAARELVLLLTIARKEELVLDDEELSRTIYDHSVDNDQDYESVLRNLYASGMIVVLKNKLLADKAMDLIWERAKITTIENPGAESAKADATETEPEKTEAGKETVSETPEAATLEAGTAEPEEEEVAEK